jgi:hypothetical protein
LPAKKKAIDRFSLLAAQDARRYASRKYVMWALIVAISLLVFLGSLVGLLFKGTRGKAKRYAWMSALAMILASSFLASEQDDQARRLGFSDNNDRRAATEAGVTDQQLGARPRRIREKQRPAVPP